MLILTVKKAKKKFKCISLYVAKLVNCSIYNVLKKKVKLVETQTPKYYSTFKWIKSVFLLLSVGMTFMWLEKSLIGND